MLHEIREKLKEINERILNHNFIKMADEGKLSETQIREFFNQQWYIVNHDVRSLAIMISRSTSEEELDFFIEAMEGDYNALKSLKDQVGPQVIPNPQSVAYTHFLSWLALYANAGEQALALVINLPIWAQNCKRLSEALKKNYGFNNTEFLDSFASMDFVALDNKAEKIISKYKGRYEEIARLIQAYELMFWDSLII
jgi:thiaminase